jgi:hypothetical protein
MFNKEKYKGASNVDLLLAPSVGVCFGSKREPYYDCEDYTITEYSYDDLSLTEKEFYESRSN